MITDSDFEAWVRAELAVIAEGVTPRPDPYGRLVRRRRVGWFRRGFVAGVAALAAGAGGVLVVAGPGGSPEPPPGVDLAGELRWVASLVEAAPRGLVAADGSFISDLAARIQKLSDTSGSPAFDGARGQPSDELAARVLFVDDVDDRRVALVALERAEVLDARRRYPLTRLLWLAGPRGGSPGVLAGAVESAAPADGTDYRVTQVEPFAHVGFEGGTGPIRVALAPPECEVAATPATDHTEWRPEPTGSYLVRTAAQYVPEYWRVTCVGATRVQMPAPRVVTADGDDGALPGPVPIGPQLVRERPDVGAQSLQATLYEQFGFELLEPARVLWSGPIAQPPAADAQGATATATVTVVAAPAARGGWIAGLDFAVEVGPGQFTGVWPTPILSAAIDLGAPDGVLAFRVPGFSRLVLVLPPAAATWVRLLDRDGRVVAESAVTDPALLLYADVTIDLAQIQALDGTREPIVTTDLATAAEPTGFMDWS